MAGSPMATGTALTTWQPRWQTCCGSRVTAWHPSCPTTPGPAAGAVKTTTSPQARPERLSSLSERPLSAKHTLHSQRCTRSEHVRAQLRQSSPLQAAHRRQPWCRCLHAKLQAAGGGSAIGPGRRCAALGWLLCGCRAPGPALWQAAKVCKAPCFALNCASLCQIRLGTAHPSSEQAMCAACRHCALPSA